jgi:EAL domain-containing protein (putative c-di-GMP-specific phosphodiesterase class I)
MPEAASPVPARALPRLALAARCPACHAGERFRTPLAFAFQPIVDVVRRRVFAQEALVRGASGEGAASILCTVTPEDRYGFDQACRTGAIAEAGRLGLASTGALLSINFLPNAVYEPQNCIRATLAAAERAAFPLNSLMFEVTEGEEVRNVPHLQSIVSAYKEMGFTVAVDDFGAGHAGLSLLADFQPDIVKLDMGLIRGIHLNRSRQVLVKATLGACADLGISVVVEGVEDVEEYGVLRGYGVELFHGYLFAQPALAALPEPAYPA